MGIVCSRVEEMSDSSVVILLSCASSNTAQAKGCRNRAGASVENVPRGLKGVLELYPGLVSPVLAYPGLVGITSCLFEASDPRLASEGMPELMLFPILSAPFLTIRQTK